MFSITNGDEYKEYNSTYKNNIFRGEFEFGRQTSFGIFGIQTKVLLLKFIEVANNTFYS